MKTISRRRALPVVLAALVVVIGVNLAAYAGNGSPFVLGHSNSEGSPSTLSNSGSGPALRLVTGKAAPPLSVSSSHVVKHLNADSVDGARVSTLSHVFVYPVPGGTTAFLGAFLKGIPKGTYQASLDIEMSTNTPQPSRCELDNHVDPIPVIGYGASDGSLTVVSASGVITAHTRGGIFLSCLNGQNVINNTTVVSTVTLNPVVKSTQGTVKVAISRSR